MDDRQEVVLHVACHAPVEPAVAEETQIQAPNLILTDLGTLQLAVFHPLCVCEFVRVCACMCIVSTLSPGEG